MTQLHDPAELVEQMTGLLDAGTGLRRAADLIHIRGYNRWAPVDPADDDQPGAGLSVPAAIRRIARDDRHAEDLECRFAGWLVLTGGRVAATASQIVSQWETIAPGSQRDEHEVTATLASCATALVTYAEALGRAAR